MDDADVRRLDLYERGMALQRQFSQMKGEFAAKTAEFDPVMDCVDDDGAFGRRTMACWLILCGKVGMDTTVTCCQAF